MTHTIGEIAYNAYGEVREWKVFSGDPMPNWEEQDAELKQAWEAAALAVVREVRG